MALTPLDIKNKSFEVKFRGFDKDEVDDFLDQVVTDYETAIVDRKELEKALKAAGEKLEYYTDLKDALNKSIVVAQDAADKLKDNAESESHAIVLKAETEATQILSDAKNNAKDLMDNAKNEASAILNDARTKAQRLAIETEALKSKTKSFHKRLTTLLESQMEIVNDDEWDDLFVPYSSYIEDDFLETRELYNDGLEEVLIKENIKPVETKKVEAKPTVESKSTAGTKPQPKPKETNLGDTTTIVFPKL